MDRSSAPNMWGDYFLMISFVDITTISSRKADLVTFLHQRSAEAHRSHNQTASIQQHSGSNIVHQSSPAPYDLNIMEIRAMLKPQVASSCFITPLRSLEPGHEREITRGGKVLLRTEGSTSGFFTEVWPSYVQVHSRSIYMKMIWLSNNKKYTPFFRWSSQYFHAASVLRSIPRSMM